jgi:predicted methyltransferase
MTLTRPCLVVILACLVAGAALGQANPIAQALADPRRPAQDLAADARRKPAETLAFAGAAPGMAVAELFPGGGYYSRLLARDVGKTGHLWLLPWGEPQSGRSRSLAADPAYGNITDFEANPLAFRPPRPLDMVFTVQNYHDIASPQRGQVNQAVSKWLRPGGVYVIVDHAAVDGSGYASLPLHRIDEALVKREVEAAGFALAGESQVLRNPADDRKLIVFDPAIRGRTDQFMLRFVKK